jgi:D-arabinose 1-dehydrogenase
LTSAPTRANSSSTRLRLGVSVMGVSRLPELHKTIGVWRSILDGLDAEVPRAANRWRGAHEWSLARRRAIQLLAEGVREVLDEWTDWSWESGQAAKDIEPNRVDTTKEKKQDQVETVEAPWPTPVGSPESPGLPLR